ncbi:hypothetical protein AAFF_G00416490 [Aldrovandia affinis]|uniref:Uncharacterized protein n=1 Tax=Aldrovandia affinis TaxID=143900 RepID=A0AAD7WJ98_9TELE|nr:hypothetical protein AAFF_G00416490 [Aldrovandia affinis]
MREKNVNYTAQHMGAVPGLQPNDEGCQMFGGQRSTPLCAAAKSTPITGGSSRRRCLLQLRGRARFATGTRACGLVGTAHLQPWRAGTGCPPVPLPPLPAVLVGGPRPCHLHAAHLSFLSCAWGNSLLQPSSTGLDPSLPALV